jgi:pyruvate,water dikinase
MGSYVLGFDEIDRTQVAVAGGKGAQLGELSRIEGVVVPPGFCVTTEAYRRVVVDTPEIEERLALLSDVDPDDRESIRRRSAEVRETIERAPLPEDVAAAITTALSALGGDAECAVRSSATSEDLPTASFAGQHDTYLNVVGPNAVLDHISRCWASLFTERAVTYRRRNAVDDRKVHMAVLVQHMAFPDASGIVFTADPVTSNRKVVAVEATFGLGEALVSGLVEADAFHVRGGEVVARTIGTKRLAIVAVPGGGTRQQAIEAGRQDQPALSDAQVVEVAALGRRIEAHFGCPQDIEWCRVDHGFQIVQSRPITALFPIPPAADGENHVYVSVGHQQMMTDPMKPLGLSMWKLTAGPPMHEAGGRLFVDVTQRLASPSSRAALLEVMGRSDPLVRDALETVLDRGDFVPTVPEDAPGGEPPGAGLPGGAPPPIEVDPAVVTELIDANRASVAALQRAIATKTGTELLDLILADVPEMKRLLFDPRSHQVFMSAMDASWWLNEHLEEWLGERNVADTLTQSVPNNVTSEMGLALLDVAAAIRPHPEVVAFLRDVEDGEEDVDLFDGLTRLPGGPAARDAIQGFLREYGMRCVGEIDITRPRWSESPRALVPVILGNVDHFQAGEGERRFEQGRREAAAKEQEVLERLRALPDGERKAQETKEMIDRVRTFIGYREYPKYGMVSRYFVYKQALAGEADRLVEAGVLEERDDIDFLTFQELQEVVRTHRADRGLIEERKEAFRSYRDLVPPRVLTSDGEAVAGSYGRDDVPAGALVGLAVSAGTVEGRARVIHDMEEADLEPGDILVTSFTDPSWTPLFVTVAGLVTEVGGVMTHGAVIAREYGLPAVVGVERATQLIRDGQRIRVHGTAGYVELLA